jgi:hypothetical protein
MIVFGQTYGIEGIAGSRLAAVVLTIPIIFYVEKRFLGGALYGYWFILIARLAPAVSLLAGVEYVVQMILPNPFLGFALAVAAGTAVYIGALYILGFIEKEEINLIRSVIMKKSSTA